MQKIPFEVAPTTTEGLRYHTMSTRIDVWIDEDDIRLITATIEAYDEMCKKLSEASDEFSQAEIAVKGAGEDVFVIGLDPNAEPALIGIIKQDDSQPS